MLAKRCIIFCAVSITCTTDAALLFFNHSYRERMHALVPNANPHGILNPAALTVWPACDAQTGGRCLRVERGTT